MAIANWLKNNNYTMSYGVNLIVGVVFICAKRPKQPHGTAHKFVHSYEFLKTVPNTPEIASKNLTFIFKSDILIVIRTK